jgi:hypothetical protein
MITLDYRVSKLVIWQNREVGKETSSVRQVFKNDSDGMARFQDLKDMGLVESVQLTWTLTVDDLS